jgi:hypothetical protein
MAVRLNQSITLARFWAGLIAGGIVMFYVTDAVDMITAKGRSAASSPAATQGVEWSAIIFDSLPFIVTFIGLLGLLVTAIYQRRGVRATP